MKFFLSNDSFFLSNKFPVYFIIKDNFSHDAKGIKILFSDDLCGIEMFNNLYKNWNSLYDELSIFPKNRNLIKLGMIINEKNYFIFSIFVK